MCRISPHHVQAPSMVSFEQPTFYFDCCANSVCGFNHHFLSATGFMNMLGAFMGMYLIYICLENKLISLFLNFNFLLLPLIPCVLDRTGAGLFIRLPDRGHTVMDHGFFPRHFSKCHRSWDLPRLRRCSPCWHKTLRQGYCDVALTFCCKYQLVSDLWDWALCLPPFKCVRLC